MKKLKKPSVRTVNHRDGGMSFYTEGGEFDFVRNQSPKAPTNFEQRLYHTPFLNNEDGSISSHKMMSWSDENGEHSAPTIVYQNGQLVELTADQAIDYAYKTGEFKTFSSPEESMEYGNNGYKYGTPMEIFAPNPEFEPNALVGGRNQFAKGGELDKYPQGGAPQLFPAPSLAFQKKAQDFVKQKDAQKKEQEELQKQVKGKKVIATLKPKYNNAMHTDTSGPYGNGYTQEQQRYFESKNIPTHLWAVEQKKLDDAATVARRKQVEQQAIKDLEKGDFTKARAENLTNAFRFFPDDANSFIDDYLNPFQLTGSLAGNLGSNFASDAGPLNAKKLALDIAAPLAVGMFGSLGAESTGQFINNLVNPLAGTGEFLTTRTPLKNAYKLNPWAFKPQKGMMYRGLGEEGFKDAVESGVFRPKQMNYPEKRSLSEIVNSPKQFDGTYYAPSEKFNVVKNYDPSYLAEVPFSGNNFGKRYGRKDWSWSTKRQIPIEEGRVLKKDWIKGYKEVPVSKTPSTTNSQWAPASREYLKKEYDIEVRKKGLDHLISEEDFINQGMAQKASPIKDAMNLEYRTINPTRESIIDQSKYYASWPEFRNEQTIDNIYQGFNSGSAMDPIIIMNLPDGGRKIIAGNTRLNVAEQLGITPHAITINPKSKFKSEIDWAKWNPETPKQPDLMSEYNYIEETAKKNGTWMKNADGTPYEGTPEQFVQENSSWFKKAYPKGYDVTYRGVNPINNNPDFSLPPIGYETQEAMIGDRGIFTANRDLANVYDVEKIKGKLRTPFSRPEEGGLYELIHPRGKEINYNVDGNDWLDINLSKNSSKINLEYNLDQVTKNIKKYKNIEDYPQEIIENLEIRKKQLESYIKEFDQLNTSANIEELKKLRNALGDITTTDKIAGYLKNSDLRKVNLKNINDGSMGDVTIVSNRPGNYLKSKVGNIGYFDMNSPHVFKNLFLPGLGAAMYNYYNPTAPPQQEFGGIQLSNRMFEEGGEYELTQEEIDNLKSQGYDLELL